MNIEDPLLIARIFSIMKIDIYHITSIENLEGIIRSGNIYCDSDIKALGIEIYSYSKEDLKQERSLFEVPICCGGVISDYVPFFFTNRPPMLLSIKYRFGSQIQRRFLHLVSSVEAIINSDLPFCYTDGHAIMSFTDFYEDLELLEEVIDWELIENGYWADTEDDNDRKRRKQAEFLVYNRLPWSCIESIVVKDNSINNDVKEILKRLREDPNFSYALDIPIVTKPDWYY
ncbi:MAG TPA: DUF4433 domain-containing protein [Methanospirillum sp.]|jgi:hypothetical protein|uniref:type II toxin-antitoxin system toxin DNA ADP-ribosyl transferase DarT n=1 Tax=Methanospirillum sp. TaxID=45200 RepID=UPI002BCF9B8F|nr:DUF4433 domain-containing protein [Methanospirillum sp.]HPY59335.1 DUF4433 domain-containing protein [Methanospirillum sp.]